MRSQEAGAGRRPGGRALPLAGAMALAVLLGGALAAAPDVRAQSKWEQHYHERVAWFRKENAALDPGKRTVVFLGDSITEGFPLSKLLPELSPLNRGISADRIGQDLERGVLHRLDESVFGAHAGVVFLLIGINDLTASPKPPAFRVEGVAAIVAAIRARAPKTRVVLQTLLPLGRGYKRHAETQPRVLAFNEGLRALAKAQRLPLLDLHRIYVDEEGFLPDDLSADGLHLKRAAFARWAEAVRAMLK